MDWSISLSIVGIIVSILIGLFTFYVADKRSRRRRWYQAKETILMELSKSLSEGNVPNLEIMSATIRSVLRDSNVGEFDLITIDEILDDLIRQITSDPFLDSERRKQLQGQLLSVKTEEVTMMPREKDSVKREAWIRSMAPTLATILYGVFVTLILAIIFANVETLLRFIRVNLEKAIDLGAPISAATITGIVTILISIYSFFRSKSSKIARFEEE